MTKLELGPTSPAGTAAVFVSDFTRSHPIEGCTTSMALGRRLQTIDDFPMITVQDCGASLVSSFTCSVNR